MKRILFIIWSYSLGGGAEALLTTIVNHLNARKYQIGIIEIYHSETKKEPVNPGIKIYDPITFEGDREYRKKMYYIYREPERMIKKYIPSDYDLYVSFNYQTPSFLLPEGGRNIAWVHTSVYDLAERGLEDYRKLQCKAFEKTMKIVSISDITTKSIQDLFPEHADKVVEIYNAIDIKEVRKKADSFTQLTLEHPSIVYVGRLDENKDPLRMMDIFCGIARRDSSVHLYFLGKGELEPQVRERASEYGLQSRVHLLGYYENPFPVLKQADVCCVTSKAEGFPMRLLESVALHVPFVSTEVGGAGILANEGRCGRVYATNEQAVRDISELLDTPGDLVEEECEKSISRFGLDTYILKIEHMFDMALKKTMEPKNDIERERADEDRPLEDKRYYYHFPDGLVPKGSRVVLYGAGDVGTDYYHYIREANDCQVVSWVDAAAAKYRNCGRDVRDVDTISDLDYDVILIAVMDETVSRSIKSELQKRDIPGGKILWERPIF